MSIDSKVVKISLLRSFLDLIAFINSIGGINNWERYKIISELLSSRIIINNPEN